MGTVTEPQGAYVPDMHSHCLSFITGAFQISALRQDVQGLGFIRALSGCCTKPCCRNHCTNGDHGHSACSVLSTIGYRQNVHVHIRFSIHINTHLFAVQPNLVTVCVPALLLPRQVADPLPQGPFQQP